MLMAPGGQLCHFCSPLHSGRDTSLACREVGGEVSWAEEWAPVWGLERNDMWAFGDLNITLLLTRLNTFWFPGELWASMSLSSLRTGQKGVKEPVVG